MKINNPKAKLIALTGIPSFLIPILCWGFVQINDIPKTYCSKSSIIRMESRIDKKIDRLEDRIDSRLKNIQKDLRLLIELTKK